MDLAGAIDEAGAVVVEVTATSDAALTACLTQSIHGALLDVHLVGQSTSFPVADELTKLGIPFIFYTSDPHYPQLNSLFPSATIVPKTSSSDDAIAVLLSKIAW